MTGTALSSRGGVNRTQGSVIFVVTEVFWVVFVCLFKVFSSYL